MQLQPRLESLILKTGLHLGVLSDSDRAVVLALAACAIEPGQPLREDEVNRRLIDWLADVGQMLHTDHVELRRWLVDAGFVAAAVASRASSARAIAASNMAATPGTPTLRPVAPTETSHPLLIAERLGRQLGYSTGHGAGAGADMLVAT